jgi:hypothetical protein
MFGSLEGKGVDVGNKFRAVDDDMGIPEHTPEDCTSGSG